MGNQFLSSSLWLLLYRTLFNNPCVCHPGSNIVQAGLQPPLAPLLTILCKLGNSVPSTVPYTHSLHLLGAWNEAPLSTGMFSQPLPFYCVSIITSGTSDVPLLASVFWCAVLIPPQWATWEHVLLIWSSQEPVSSVAEPLQGLHKWCMKNGVNVPSNQL